jgi:transketolase
MIGVAAGLALCGLRPVCYTIAPFVTYRCMEQIRVDLCYHHLPVAIVGTGSGLAYASLGGTHHSCEEVAMLRSLPGMTVLAPADPMEVRACLRAALTHPHPSYMRIGKKGEKPVHNSPPALTIGRSLVLREGGNACILAAGVLLAAALEAAEILAGRGTAVEVVSCPTIKPLDVELLRRVFSTFGLVATVEEHSVLGGFGGSVAEWLSDQKQPAARLLRFGTPDEFLHETCEQEHAHEKFGLTSQAMARRIEAALAPAAR